MNPTQDSLFPFFRHEDKIPHSICKIINDLLADRVQNSLPFFSVAIVRYGGGKYAVFLYNFVVFGSSEKVVYHRAFDSEGNDLFTNDPLKTGMTKEHRGWQKYTAEEMRLYWSELRSSFLDFERVDLD